MHDINPVRYGTREREKGVACGLPHIIIAVHGLRHRRVAVEDALVGLFDHSDHTLQRRVVESYIRRLYQVYQFYGQFILFSNCVLFFLGRW